MVETPDAESLGLAVVEDEAGDDVVDEEEPDAEEGG